MKDKRREKAVKRAEALVEQMTADELISSLRYDSPEIRRLGIAEYNWWNEGLHGAARSGTATASEVTMERKETPQRAEFLAQRAILSPFFTPTESKIR